jgi:uncharacterized protein YcnI
VASVQQQAARASNSPIRIVMLTLTLAVISGCDRATTPPPRTLPTGIVAAPPRDSASTEQPCPGWKTSLTARDLTGRCRAYPKPTPGALEALPDVPASKGRSRQRRGQ